MTIVSFATNLLHRIGPGLARLASDTLPGHALALTAAGASGRHGAPRASTPRGRPGLVAQAVRTVRDIYVLARDAEAGRPEAREAELAQTRLRATAWQTRAEVAERQLADLERRLASSEMTALDLRSRIVCLHGKLATSTATARYQTMALALENQTRGGDEAGDWLADGAAPA